MADPFTMLTSLAALYGNNTIVITILTLLILCFAAGYSGLIAWFYVYGNNDDKWRQLQLYDRVGISLLLGIWSFFIVYLSANITLTLIYWLGFKTINLDIVTAKTLLMLMIFLVFFYAIGIGKLYKDFSKKRVSFIEPLFSFFSALYFFFFSLGALTFFVGFYNSLIRLEIAGGIILIVLIYLGHFILKNEYFFV